MRSVPQPVAGAPLLRAQGARVAAGGRTIIEHADLAVDAGRIVAIVGPNGAGKSTLVRAVAGLAPVAGGSVHWRGRPVGEYRPRDLARLRAFVPQRAAVPAGLTARDAVALGRAPHLAPLRRATGDDWAAVDRALDETGSAALADRALTTLSGGELQRVRLAAALARRRR